MDQTDLPPNEILKLQATVVPCFNYNRQEYNTASRKSDSEKFDRSLTDPLSSLSMSFINSLKAHRDIRVEFDQKEVPVFHTFVKQVLQNTGYAIGLLHFIDFKNDVTLFN